MNDLLQSAAAFLSKFLGATLPKLSQDWWKKNAIDRLSFRQQRLVTEQRIDSLEQLDLAALLRVVDQNWYELSYALSLPRDAKTWIRELQSVRNRWAHLPAESIPASDIYRDADTLGRVIELLGAGDDLLAEVEAMKSKALNAVSKTGHRSPDPQPRHTKEEDNHPAAASDSTEGPAFKLGDLVTLQSDSSVTMAIIEVLSEEPECRYRVLKGKEKALYYESQLQHSEGDQGEPITLDAESLRAFLTSLQILAPSTATLFSLRSGRVQFIPYQYRPVLRLLRADRPRLLIADEVGVGKTIEAGLIIKELRARMDIRSILIICPKPLVAEKKWFVEMKRFDEHFMHLDGPALRHCLHETHLDGEWPEQYSKVILPYSLLDSNLIDGSESKTGRKKTEGLADLDPPARFDLVIVDEAHYIKNSETYWHAAVRYFCENAQAAVFLTATPIQLGSEDLFTLLNVLRPDLIIDRTSYEQMAEPNRSINAAIQRCREAADAWPEMAQKCLAEAAQTPWGRMFIRESPSFQSVYDDLGNTDIDDKTRVGIIRSLEELYTFSSLINRTRRRDIGEFTTRKPETISVDFTEEQKRLHDSLLSVIARILSYTHGHQNVKFLMTMIRRQAASCIHGLAPLLRNILEGKLNKMEMMEVNGEDFELGGDFIGEIQNDIKELLALAEELQPIDPKVEALVRVIKDKSLMRRNKSLVFSTFRHTLAYLEKYLEPTGLRYGVVHGEIPEWKRTELRHRFALGKEDENAIDVMLSSEVGCEGLDFQFCDLLVNYDLPWNPMRVEQRIGRIDRFGQESEAVAIVNLVTPGTVDADIYERCLWRIGVFRHALGGSEEILGKITREIRDIADSYELTAEERRERFQQLADNTIREKKEEQDLEERDAELFGLTVPNQAWREEIEAAESYWLSPASLQRCVRIYLARRLNGGSEYLLGEKSTKTLRLNQAAREALLLDFKALPRSSDTVYREWERWLKGNEPIVSVTFDQETASERPEVMHLNVLHPVVRQAAVYLDHSDPVRSQLAVKTDSVEPGRHQFAIYRWKKRGVKTDEELVVVSACDKLAEDLMSLLPGAEGTQPADSDDVVCTEDLDAIHYRKWTKARVDHIAANREIVEHRIQSLTASHTARCRQLEDRIAEATNEGIRRMKESELDRANVDVRLRLRKLNEVAESGDIDATPVVFGDLTIESECES